MKKLNRINTLTGWIIFLIATAVYILTIEPTASFWDCSEFIATAYKMEVGHPPGAYLFMMLGKLATLFAGHNHQAIAATVNTYSAICSGFTILFLFWTITHLARKIIGEKETYSTLQIISIIGSGVVGALAYTFSDSFWFSAVEAEVYASSSLFTALVFWAILKWENVAGERYANRWLILIAYLMGLSIGVHLLNLLAIPAIVLIYYFKKYRVTRTGILKAVLISLVLLAVILYGIIQGTFVVASWFELLFVNHFGLPFNSGFLFFVVALVASIIWGIRYTLRHGKVVMNTILLCLAVILLGYSSVAALVIRSNADTPLNENNPSNLFDLLAYLNRDQYGDCPLIYGPTYNAPILGMKEGKAIYAEKDGKYVAISHKPEYIYDSHFKTIFPRMYSRSKNHVSGYKEWARIKGTPIPVTGEEGKTETIYKPTFFENLAFFLKYQVSFMYFRYFMWNFSGRQNDIQGYGEITKGNWITGIPFIDAIRLGPQDHIPPSIKDNRGRNTYYMLPLLLGLIGLFYHLKKQKKDFWVVMILFFMTGLAIVIYLNQTPYQPRERDYAYAGSFYAFAIWIGLGVMALIDLIPKKIRGVVPALLVTLLLLLCVPVIMAEQNWNDHDRSDRYACRDFAYDYLNSCAPNAIIFTEGDNDTFPLWYLQEVENVRTDVRVINLSYLNADWYIEQMQRKLYNSDIVPFTLHTSQYQTGTRDILYVIDRMNQQYTDLKGVMDFVASDDPRTKTLPNVTETVDYIPADRFFVKVDSSQVVANKVVSPYLYKSIVREMKWGLNDRRAIYKNSMMVLDLIANNNWTRPIYFAISVPDASYLGLERYFQLQGMAYRLVPVASSKSSDYRFGSIDPDILYNNLMHKFRWGHLSHPKVYIDPTTGGMLINFRNSFSRLAEELNNLNRPDSATKVLDKCFQVMPVQKVPLNYWSLPLIEQYYRANHADRANPLVTRFYKTMQEELTYYFRFKDKFAEDVSYQKQMDMHILNELVRMTARYGQKELSSEINDIFQKDLKLYGPTQ